MMVCQKNESAAVSLSSCKSFPFFHEIWIAADQVIENERTKYFHFKLLLDPPHLKSMVLLDLMGNVRVI